MVWASSLRGLLIFTCGICCDVLPQYFHSVISRQGSSLFSVRISNSFEEADVNAFGSVSLTVQGV